MPYSSPERYQQYQQEWRKQNRQHLLAYQKTYREDNTEQIALAKRVCYQTVRLEAPQHYSGMKPQCKCCGVKNLAWLTLDHIKGDGAPHRQVIGRVGNGFPYWLKRNGWPDGFQVLCWNCNAAKRDNLVCPHKQLIEAATKGQRHYQKTKATVLQYYSDMPVPECEGCGTNGLPFLTIDHIGGGGVKHRQQEKGVKNIYWWLKNQNFPKGYRVLCWNCNCAQKSIL